MDIRTIDCLYVRWGVLLWHVSSLKTINERASDAPNKLVVGEALRLFEGWEDSKERQEIGDRRQGK